MNLPAPWNEITQDQWQSLADTHGTPFYLFDVDTVLARIRAVRGCFEGLVGIYYAVKSNPNLGLLKALQGHVDGVDISSGGEQVQAALAGFAPGEMSFAGPAKTDIELRAAISAGIGAISVETFREISACARIAASLGASANVAIRFNPKQVNRHFGLKMGGKAIQFGLDEEQVEEVLDLVRSQSMHLNVVGVHLYVGSQCFEVEGVVEATRNALRIAEDVMQRTDFEFKKVNLGGGFGVSSTEPKRELDIAALSTELIPMLRAFRQRHPTCEPFFELGRYLTADAGVYVTRVVSTKQSRGKVFAACDGGLNHCLTAAGTFGAALRSNFPLRNLTHPDSTLVTCSVSGPSCNPTDLLGVDARVPSPEEGDLMAVLGTGSYGMTASPVLFLGRTTPVELVRYGKSITVGRPAFGIEHFN